MGDIDIKQRLRNVRQAYEEGLVPKRMPHHERVARRLSASGRFHDDPRPQPFDTRTGGDSIHPWNDLDHPKD